MLTCGDESVTGVSKLSIQLSERGRAQSEIRHMALVANPCGRAWVASADCGGKAR